MSVNNTGKMNLELIKALLISVLAFCLIPALTYGFVRYAEPRVDADYVEAVVRNVQADATLPAEQKAAIETFVRTVSPSAACSQTDPELQAYRSQVCAPYSMLWQFRFASLVSWWTLIAGAGLFAAIFVLAAVAFVSRGARYMSFLLGWRLLTVASAIAVIVQGSLAVWLAFWAEAYFIERVSVKIMLVIALLAALAAFYAVVMIFRRQRHINQVEGVLLRPEDEPKLWAHVRGLAQRIGTAPPDHIIAGIDTNFFVTEAPLVLGGQDIKGRSLFISLPLLRVLDVGEADAVLAHELAHFRGGDAASSAKLGPQLLQYDFYCAAMRTAKVFITYYALRLYRLLFEFALQRDSRYREFVADRAAAALTSGQAIIHSLIKVAAYASYRGQIERQLFEYNQRHGGSLGIGGQVAAGLAPYAASPQFVSAMRSANVPHPFDSHPLLRDRMANVGCEIGEESYAAIATAVPALSWANEIQTARKVEDELWAHYEQQFASAHEESLAYRYLPSNAEEEALVLKYFPPLSFDLKRGLTVEVSYSGIAIANASKAEASKVIPWDDITSLTVKSETLLGDQLIIGQPKQRMLSFNNTKLRLRGLGKDQERFKALLGAYWRRHQIMRQVIAASGPSATESTEDAQDTARPQSSEPSGAHG
jgi:Zn-dependent protease with chaperone function